MTDRQYDRIKKPPNPPSSVIPFTQVNDGMKDRCTWAKLCMVALWDRFIAKLEAQTFSPDEITRDGKRLRNLMGSVEAHRKTFIEAVNEMFDVDVS